jgi:hypothetical protein
MRFFALARKKKTSSPLPIIGAESVLSLAAEGITADCSQRPERKEVTFGTRRQALERNKTQCPEGLRNSRMGHAGKDMSDIYHKIKEGVRGQ